ncbi:MAG: D-2-hydroxyacid dehydrogenase [Bacillota bacterium]
MRILVNAKVDRKHLDKIQAGFPKVEVLQTADSQEALALVQEAEVLLTWWSNFDEKFLESPSLRWVHALSAGVDGFLLSPIVEGKIILSNSSGIHGIPISEHVFAMMLSFSRGLHRFGKYQAQNLWRRDLHLTELRGKTLGIVGLGQIGQEIARLGNAFGMRVLAVKRNPGQPLEGVNRVVSMEGLEMVLKESDYLVLTVPLTPETKGFIGARQLELMKPSAILINVARGEVVDQDDLIAALQQGVIAGAGLDVFETEPLDSESPLWQLENCIITPHCAALSPQYMTRATDLFCRNLDAYLRGEPLPTQVDPKRGY